MKWGVYLDK